MTYVVQSGPALLAGSRVTPTGAPGKVVLVASQAGDATWNAAPDVVQAFTVTAAGMYVFFGSVNAGGASRVGDIAAALGTAPTTIKKHLTHVFDKVGVDTRTQLIARIA